MDDITAAPPRAALRRRAAEPAPSTPDPVEIAMELERGDLSPESPARQLLERHVRLVEKQLGLADNERFRARIKALRDAALAGLAVLVLVGVLAVVWDAARSRSLAVQAFSVPPELAARGATGEVLAAQMIDRLADLQAKTDSARPADSYAQDWSGGLTVEIPQTGVSLDQALQMLKSRLGRRTVIRGEVVRGPDGRLQLTVRSGAGPAATVSGDDADLPGLLNQAAEAVYAQTQPYRYAIMLAATPENRARSLETFRGLTHHADRTERGWAWVGVTTTLFDLGDVDAALAATRHGAALDSSLVSDTNAALLGHMLGREEQALAHADLAARQQWRTTRVAAAITAADMTAQAAAWRGDLPRAERLFAAAGDMPEYAGTAAAARLRRGEILARLHEP
ncbi:hypothetical protein, partial [Caulobacter sp. 17J65-9]|uniref:hypothetical protein n=1 Tax=Caulobacter sp. 17J65-9 TaxID=2709382 RepID=UPI0013C6FCB7